ncbi:hypothetical protein J4E93_003126 [Alternaria ventricosa]|uniref:uncharacterized protein n=1 Tax=Alternaria ventricosa TaxID=1187951 RepID=UPI0020C33F3A|nr:uncharacterized protein J4E93_003126 [Alternaria ventricosa]KAI4650769.1 hypothetical protein J4E93_003126 [Alternaria ventricosa]
MSTRMDLTSATNATATPSSDDLSAPIGTEDSESRQNGEVETTLATNPTNLIDLTDEGFNIADGYPKNMTLDIGGRRFRVARSTLEAESGLFQRQFSDCYSWTPEPDGSYFLDADPDLFEHLLRYMRRPEVFPLFYSVMNGLDYDLYNRLQAEARYFQINKLYKWIEAKVLGILLSSTPDTDMQLEVPHRS